MGRRQHCLRPAPPCGLLPPMQYTSRAAQLYRSMLEKEAAKLTPAQAMAIASG